MTKKRENKKLEPAKQPIRVSKISDRRIDDEMSESYLDYAMSVIVSRALPDVRDGLKPVHRRILYAMWNLGLKPGAKFRKSATVVGEVLGKYHPHGDIAVYDSLVRLAQSFSMRYQLIQGQGNFGSMDGDGAAAMRYTEAKLAKISEQMLADLEKETVGFIPNYDGTQKEPEVLPSLLPNLIVNGTMGIAVGMATNIPPHNLSEIIDGIIFLIDHTNANIDDLVKFIKGPDFPTGGIIYDVNEIKQTYATGKGSIIMRAKTEILEKEDGLYQILVTEMPYQVNKALLIEKIARLVQEKRLEGIRDLRDESDKEGVRIVIELKRDAYPQKVLNRLFTVTQLQDTFHVNTLALVDGIQPRVLNLKMVLEEYIEHRKEVVRRRTQFDLNKATERAHILQGLKLALLYIDRVIAIIKKSRNKEEAHKNLMKKFRLTDLQSQAILEMKLQQLANLERLAVLQELKDKLALIKELKNILASPAKIKSILKDELKKLKEDFGDERRTEIVPQGVGKFSQEDLIPKEPTIVVVTRDNYIKRCPPDTFKTQSRGGKGVIGLTTKEEDVVERIFATNTHADLLFFTTKGRVFQLKAYNIPKASRTARGQALVNFLQLSPNEEVTEAIPVENLSSYKYLVMVTRQGVIKKVDVNQFGKVRRSGLIAIRLKRDDTLKWVKASTGKDDIILVTAEGQSIRFKERDVRPMGRAASGVRGIRLRKGDFIVGMDIISSGSVSGNEQLLVVMKNGYGKRTGLKNYKVQRRGGSGVKTANITDKTGALISAFIVSAKLEKEDLIAMSARGQVIRLPLKSVSVLGRATQGVRLMSFKEIDDKVASVTFV